MANRAVFLDRDGTMAPDVHYCGRPEDFELFPNNAGYTKVIVSKVAVNRWLPGSIDLFTDEFFKAPKDLPPGEVADVVDNLALPANIAAGQYVLSLAVVDEAEKPVVRLGIKGRADDGWYPISKLTVK